jgi:Zn-dependent peptidase ImmA (M78 family)/transcriptional regulator with XRE-family HTH domain
VTGAVNPEMITVARESRGMNQEQLAKAMEVSQSKLSKYENGMLAVSDDDASALSAVLGYTPDLFVQDSDKLGAGSVCIHHRKRASVPVSKLKAIHAQLRIFRLQVDRLLDGVDVETSSEFHGMDVDQFGGPEKVAQEARRLWKVADGPVGNVIAIIERAGGIVRKMDFGTKLIDAVSQVIPGKPPIFFVGSGSPCDRLRFTMSHEIGHALMHQLLPSPNIETEADRFASEFLMPGTEIGPSLRNLSLAKLPSLKGHWKVSMAAIVKRAFDLRRIDERQYRTLFSSCRFPRADGGSRSR